MFRSSLRRLEFLSCSRKGRTFSVHSASSGVRRNAVSLLALCLLVVQLVVPGSIVASYSPSGSFLVELCTADGIKQIALPGEPGAPPKQDHLPNCCVTGCAAAAAGTLPPVAFETAVIGLDLSETRIEYSQVPVLVLSRSYLPQAPRAPPAV